MNHNIFLLTFSDDDAVIEALCKASLPSTLVKSIYLFFDLPSTSNDQKEMYLKLNEFLNDILGRLCKFRYFLLLLASYGIVYPIHRFLFRVVSEELAKKDDLSLLFVATSSSVSPENSMWRKTSARLLETISAHTLYDFGVFYLKGLR